MSLLKTFKLIARTGYYLKESRKENASVADLQKSWALETLTRFNVDLQTMGTPSNKTPLLFVGNHISYLDIVLLMAAVPRVSFVAKKELSLWPVFGTAARSLNTIFVDRGSQDSRAAARTAIREGLTAGKRITVFPSGTTTVDEAKQWRFGAFEVAHQMGAYIQPFRLTYTPLRHTAYIDNDFFPWHLYNLARGPHIQARLEFAEPQPVLDPQVDCLKWQEWSKLIHN